MKSGLYVDPVEDTAFFEESGKYVLWSTSAGGDRLNPYGIKKVFLLEAEFKDLNLYLPEEYLT